MDTAKYITSERFIHDELMRRAAAVVDTLPRLWKRDGRISPSIFIWPASTIRTDDAGNHDGLIVGFLPEDGSDRAAFIRSALSKTKPYAILVVEADSNRVSALFETHHGTRAWTMPIKQHGDARVLGDMQVSDDKECLGMLWRKDPGRS